MIMKKIDKWIKPIQYYLSPQCHRHTGAGASEGLRPAPTPVLRLFVFNAIAIRGRGRARDCVQPPPLCGGSMNSVTFHARHAEVTTLFVGYIAA